MLLKSGLRIEHLSFADPDLDTDRSVHGPGGCGCIVDVCAERVQRDAAFLVLLAAGDLRSTEPT